MSESESELVRDTEPPMSNEETKPDASPLDLFFDLVDTVTGDIDEHNGRPKKLWIRWRILADGRREIFSCTESPRADALRANEFEGVFS